VEGLRRVRCVLGQGRLGWFEDDRVTGRCVIDTLSLHDALPIWVGTVGDNDIEVDGTGGRWCAGEGAVRSQGEPGGQGGGCREGVERRSTRRNASHVKRSYAGCGGKSKREWFEDDRRRRRGVDGE